MPSYLTCSLLLISIHTLDTLRFRDIPFGRRRGSEEGEKNEEKCFRNEDDGFMKRIQGCVWDMSIKDLVAIALCQTLAFSVYPRVARHFIHAKSMKRNISFDLFQEESERHPCLNKGDNDAQPF